MSRSISIVWCQFSDGSGSPVFIAAYAEAIDAERLAVQIGMADPIQQVRVSQVEFYDPTILAEMGAEPSKT